MNLVDGRGDVNLSTAKKVLNEMFESGKDAEEIVEEKGLKTNEPSMEKSSLSLKRYLMITPQVVEDLKRWKKKSADSFGSVR